jgi:hypothetical protein
MSAEEIEGSEPSGAKSSKEPWDVERVEQAYNEIALEEGGWRFEKTPGKLRIAQACYEGGRHETLRDFARSWFLTTQQF